MASTPTKNIRLTISVTPEVHATFERMSKASGMSMSRAMGEWLSDTSAAADHLASLLERARAAPGQIAREMHAFALGLADETGDVVEKMRQAGREARSSGAAERTQAAGSSVPPSSNTGGKGLKSTTQRRPGVTR